MIASILKRAHFRYFLGEEDRVNSPFILISGIKLDHLDITLRGITMSSSEVWVVYSTSGIKVRTFRGTQSMLQAQDYARIIGGTAQCTN